MHGTWSLFLHRAEEKAIHPGAGRHRKSSMLPYRHPLGERHVRCNDSELRVALEESRHLLAEKNRCLKIFAVHLCKLFLMYTIPYFCLRFMGLSTALDFGQVQLLTALTLFLSNALPNVAGMGSIETAFLLVFGSFLTRGETMSILMLFRIATYYVVVAVSAAGFFFAQKNAEKLI